MIDVKFNEITKSYAMTKTYESKSYFSMDTPTQTNRTFSSFRKHTFPDRRIYYTPNETTILVPEHARELFQKTFPDYHFQSRLEEGINLCQETIPQLTQNILNTKTDFCLRDICPETEGALSVDFENAGTSKKVTLLQDTGGRWRKL